MSKPEVIAGGILGGAAAVGALFYPLANAYDNEVTTDAEAAAVAEAFVDPENLSELEASVTRAIVALEADYDRELSMVPENCRGMVVRGDDRQSIADINADSACDYSEDMIDDASDILEGIQDEVGELQDFLSGEQPYNTHGTLGVVIEDAQAVINDASEVGAWRDLSDEAYRTIDIDFDEETREFTRTYHDPAEGYGFYGVAFTAIAVAFGGLFGAGAAEAIGSTRRHRRSSQPETA